MKKNGKSVYSASELSMFDRVTFGSYPQGSMGGRAPIDWYVIEKDGDKVRLLAVSILDSCLWHRYNTAPAFQESDLYRWLNDSFIKEAFNAEENAALAAPVSLLKKNEFNKLVRDPYRTASATEYAISRGFDTAHNLWWLGEFARIDIYEDGTTACCAYCVENTGEVGWYEVDFSGKGVRPSIWVTCPDS